MYIHIGGEKMIRTDELIAIIEINMDRTSKSSKSFFDIAEDEEKIERIGDDIPKSLVITKHKCYYSPISSATLKKRIKSMSHAIS